MNPFKIGDKIKVKRNPNCNIIKENFEFEGIITTRPFEYLNIASKESGKKEMIYIYY